METAPSDEYPQPRQERRAERKAADEIKMRKHGKGLAQHYRNAVLKRAGGKPPSTQNKT
ncbi:MAG: hypothetical protein FWF18_02895 [Dehalococcoidia bacterium]|nr:hypothetical protein [Dehalococcoidia bacterium]